MFGLCQFCFQQEDVTVQLEALDILSDLLSRFGPILQQYHAMLLDALLPQLNSGRQAVRKRTVVALGYLASSCGAPHYQKMVGLLVEEMRKGLQSGHANTYIQCCATVCKNAGQRFAEYLDQVVEMLMEACKSTDDDELKENTLQAFEVFVSRCPQEMGALGHLEPVLQLCVKLISHDPNYNDDDQDFNPVNEESMDTTTGDEDEDAQNDEDEQEEDEYSDDDDMSWKVAETFFRP
jgi:cullin-associated NEDD8-dissociated protein 1